MGAGGLMMGTLWHFNSILLHFLCFRYGVCEIKVFLYRFLGVFYCISVLYVSL